MFILLLSLALLMVPNRYFLKWNEDREGSIVLDPLIKYIPRIDCSVFITLTELMTGICCFFIVGWETFEIMVLKFALTLLVKNIMLFLMPMNPPKGIIVLHDPITDYYMNTVDKPLTKDLFFSGHTSFMSLCMFEAFIVYPIAGIIMFIMTFLMGIMLLMNRVHYTIDIIAAPFIVFTMKNMVDFILK